MPKRKRSNEEDLEKLSRKIRKLERRLKKNREISPLDSEELPSEDVTADIPEQTPVDMPEEPFHDQLDNQIEEPPEDDLEVLPVKDDDEAVIPPMESAVTGEDGAPQEPCPPLDPELLEILGEDPITQTSFGDNIMPEVAQRLEHIATMGLTKEARKEFMDKYLLPANATKLGAPAMNAEIKAAVTEVVIKRDKGIETRQKQIACAISGLTQIVSQEICQKQKDNKKIRQMMDVCRVLCDVQHAESTTRRNFAIFSIKKELKEHITNTRIDKFLFGENLTETIKTANAVAKSGTDMKLKATSKPKTAQWPTKNWRTPVAARKQPGPGQQRNREPVQAPAQGSWYRAYRPPPHATASRPSAHLPKHQTRRR